MLDDGQERGHPLGDRLRRAVEPTRRMGRWLPPLFIAVGLAAGLTVVLALPLVSRDGGLQIGSPSPRNIEATRDLRFQSEVLTEQRRREAADAVGPVFQDLDNTLRRRQSERAAEVLRLVALYRAAEVSPEEASEVLGTIPELSDGVGDLADLLLDLEPETWNAVRTAVPDVVDSAMRLPIRPDALATARNSVIAYVERDVEASAEDIIARVARRFVVPNILVDEEATAAARDAARAAVEPSIQEISQGEMIVREGQRLTPLHYEALNALGVVGARPGWRSLLALAALSGGLVAAATASLWRLNPEQLRRPRQLAMAAVLLLVLAFAARLVVTGRTTMGFAFPAAALAMTLVVFAGLETAIMAGLLLSVVMGLIAQPELGGLEVVVYVLGGSVAGAVALGRVERLKAFLVAGATVLASNLLVLTAFYLPSTALDTSAALSLAGAGLVNAVLATGLAALGVLAGGTLFGVTTSLQLLELARPDHPLLRELQVKAPGTYQHSVVLGNMAERAADEIGADPLLVRVGAYYHDVGKIVRPYFFIENQLSGQNPHDDLEPQASANVIIEHVPEGARIARSHGLPDDIVDFILQHHGTTRVEYFYRQAVERAPDVGEVDPGAFRYPGPKPQSRETAIVMLADGSEAAVRAADTEQPSEIDEIVRKIIETRLMSGQLEECDITLRDLRRIRRAFVRTLRSMYHPRVDYPAQPEPRATDLPRARDGDTPALEEPEAGPLRGDGTIASDPPSDDPSDAPSGVGRIVTPPG